VLTAIRPGPYSGTYMDGACVLCMGSGCFQRDTRLNGLRQVPLCPACHGALEWHVYKREIPPGAARIIRRGAA
jgi:hypothetical protein